jgi:hypothetical protein
MSQSLRPGLQLPCTKPPGGVNGLPWSSAGRVWATLTLALCPQFHRVLLPRTIFLAFPLSFWVENPLS